MKEFMRLMEMSTSTLNEWKDPMSVSSMSSKPFQPKNVLEVRRQSQKNHLQHFWPQLPTTAGQPNAG